MYISDQLNCVINNLATCITISLLTYYLLARLVKLPVTPVHTCIPTLTLQPPVSVH